VPRKRVDTLTLPVEERSTKGSVCCPDVTTFQQGSSFQIVKKKVLVQKQTPPSEPFKYFRELQRARWQCDELDSHPLGPVVYVYDYSKGFAHRQQDETQSEYFDIARVSSCHQPSLPYDRKTSTDKKPHLIKEHLFVISIDPFQDQESVHKVEELVHSHSANDVCYNIITMHELSDGCAAQNKS